MTPRESHAFCFKIHQRSRCPDARPGMDHRSLLPLRPSTVHLIKGFLINALVHGGFEGRKGRRRSQPDIADRWAMNAPHLVGRAHVCLCCLCFSFTLYECRHVCGNPPPPWQCLLITEICTQSEEIMNKSFNYASRQRTPDVSPAPGGRRVKQEAPPPGAEEPVSLGPWARACGPTRCARRRGGRAGWRAGWRAGGENGPLIKK